MQAEWTAHPVCALCHRGLPPRLLPEDPAPLTTGQPAMRGITGPHLGGLGGPEESGGHIPTPWLPDDMTVGHFASLGPSFLLCEVGVINALQD